jgi:hypothetical protein
MLSLAIVLPGQQKSAVLVALFMLKRDFSKPRTIERAFIGLHFHKFTLKSVRHAASGTGCSAALRAGGQRPEVATRMGLLMSCLTLRPAVVWKTIPQETVCGLNACRATRSAAASTAWPGENESGHSKHCRIESAVQLRSSTHSCPR